MNFGEALEWAKGGKKIQRSGWNGNRSFAPVFVPQDRSPIVYDGLCYILLSDGSVAFCDETDYDIVSMQTMWSITNGYPYFTDYSDFNHPKTVKLHQLLNPDWEETDHKDGNKLNNRRYNLRCCTSQQNNANRNGKVGGTSRYKGVSWDSSRDKWISSIQLNRKTIHLGRFDNETDAAKAYDKKSQEVYGEFARLNFPEPKMFVFLISNWDYVNSGEKPRAPYPLLSFLAMKTADNMVVPWLISQTDALAEDYSIVE